ncbi:adhesin [Actinospica sp. MGRD01-02]|uniref:Adhesin n=1 Tax=Actinospica acidithermotolerans TaxID=2828514 RepID=A0A941E733_9ACTN|nr:adhesin [Actinospica acidithermotolerans]MBR7825007.1 adhesin [Actinospica acidithermotolerans]
MLRLTDTAADLIGKLSTQPDLPDTAGLRIESASAPGTEGGLAAELAPGPGLDDQVVEVRGARVFLDAEMVDHLSDKVLDAETKEDGQVAFHVRQQ